MIRGNTMNGIDFIKALDEGRKFACYKTGIEVYKQDISGCYIVINPMATICVLVDKFEPSSYDEREVKALNNCLNLDTRFMIDVTEAKI